MLHLLIKVKPGSGKDEITIDAQNNISIKIKAKPINGEANDYLIKFLAKEFNISKSNILLEKGATSRLKRIRLNVEQAQWDVILEKYRS